MLIADDDPTILMLLRVNLEMEGYEVVSATDGIEAVELASEQAPDLVILDIMMPRMDGLEARSKMLEIPELSQIPVIFLSARAQQVDIEKGMGSGATEYVTKPFDPPDLMSTIERILRLTKG